jgi:hypothetical protein
VLSLNTTGSVNKTEDPQLIKQGKSRNGSEHANQHDQYSLMKDFYLGSHQQTNDMPIVAPWNVFPETFVLCATRR